MNEIQEKITEDPDKISIAPMLDWTDRHFRSFLRLICRRPVFYTEMIAAPAILLGQKERFLAFDPAEQPLVLQVGGSDPKMMGACAAFASDYGYRGVNINAGCPSSRVQSGRFGAVLMKTPEVVAACVSEMRAKSSLPVSVKTRISLVGAPNGGFDDLFSFASQVRAAGCCHLIVHARQAKLNLSPKDNRAKLPLMYEVVYDLKKSFPDMKITINGNVLSLGEAEKHLTKVDGVMIGRWAYGNPYALAQIDSRFYHDAHPIRTRREILQAFLPYLEKNKAFLSVIMPHLSGLFHGEPNAKRYKQIIASRDLGLLRSFCEEGSF